MPSEIEQVHRQYRSLGLAVIAVNIRESQDTVTSWVRDKKVTMPVVVDPQGTVSRAYLVTATPTVFLVDRAGKLVGKVFGRREWTSEKARALLRILIGP